MTLDGQLSHFTSAGTLRSGPHPHDPETTLWYLETTGAAPDIALTQMPVWVKQALERPPLSAAPSPPRSSRTTRKPRAPSPSTSSPEMEIYRTPTQASGQTAHAPSCELPHLEHAKPEATENGDLEAAVAASSGDLASPATGAVEPALKQSEDAAYMPVVRWTYLALDRFDVALLSLSAPLAACLCSADSQDCAVAGARPVCYFQPVQAGLTDEYTTTVSSCSVCYLGPLFPPPGPCHWVSFKHSCLLWITACPRPGGDITSALPTLPCRHG